jgi:hypothetical protein
MVVPIHALTITESSPPDVVAIWRDCGYRKSKSLRTVAPPAIVTEIVAE